MLAHGLRVKRWVQTCATAHPCHCPPRRCSLPCQAGSLEPSGQAVSAPGPAWRGRAAEQADRPRVTCTHRPASTGQPCGLMAAGGLWARLPQELGTSRTAAGAFEGHCQELRGQEVSSHSLGTGNHCEFLFSLLKIAELQLRLNTEQNRCAQIPVGLSVCPEWGSPAPRKS